MNSKEIGIILDAREDLKYDLTMLLRETRQEPIGISIVGLARIIKGVYAPCEVESLKKELK